MADDQRSESIRRLLAAAQADIYCFQEESDEIPFRKAASLVVPTSDGQDVNLHWSGGCGIATPLPLEPIPMGLDRGAAALVELSNHEHVAVVSVHFKCCGYAGSWQDETRVYQAQQLADEIRKLRKGEFGDECRKAGIVVIGDYNLVGSRKPLDILKRAGLTDLLLRSAVDGAAYTWRGITEEESFWPGRLDLLTYDRSGLKPVMGMVVDTKRLSSSTLRELKLNADDSLASDHLLLVADFQIVR